MTLNVGIKLGGYTRSVLNDLKEIVEHDWDGVILVTGYEGDGKTSFVKLTSYYLDPTVNIGRWAYNAEQFEKIVDDPNLISGANIIWDESDELSAHWTNEVLNTLKRKFKRIRSKNLIIWLITPTFFDMNKYWAVFRTRCLFDVYANPGRNEETGKFEANRGYIRFFNRDKKRQLYFKGYKLWDMYSVMPNFNDRFGKVPPEYPISQAELEAKKNEAMTSLLNKVDGPVSSIPKYRQECMVRFETWLNTNYAKIPSVRDSEFIFGIRATQVKADRAAIRSKVAREGLRPMFGEPDQALLITRLGQKSDLKQEDDEQ